MDVVMNKHPETMNASIKWMSSIDNAHRKILQKIFRNRIYPTFKKRGCVRIFLKAKLLGYFL
jgi:hypothetical protein